MAIATQYGMTHNLDPIRKITLHLKQSDVEPIEKDIVILSDSALRQRYGIPDEVEVVSVETVVRAILRRALACTNYAAPPEPWEEVALVDMIAEEDDDEPDATELVERNHNAPDEPGI